MSVRRRAQKRRDLMARVRYGLMGKRRVAKTVELLCVIAHTRVETLGVLELMKQRPRLWERSRLKNLENLVLVSKAMTKQTTGLGHMEQTDDDLGNEG